MELFALFWLASVASAALALSAEVSGQENAFSLSFSQGSSVIHNSILADRSATPVNIKTQRRGELTTEEGGHVKWDNVAHDAVQVHASYTEGNSSVGAAFTFPANDTFYGVWGYPWNGTLANNNHSYADIGIYGTQPGINWSNARAPFFFSRSGFGVYVDSPAYGTFDFTVPTQVRFAFNATSLTYTVIYNQNLTALLMRYADLSSKIQMPPESGYGPIFWSDDFEQDFHSGVQNAQQNYYDVVDHLYYNQIRATGLFADRPYGTGNSSFGNFDFDPKFYPQVETFIANLSSYGFDFQVWVANRAFLNTQLYNISVQQNWLFPGIDAQSYLGPALNLSIPDAYNYFLQKLSYFARVGVKGFKIDRGEEHEMPDAEQNVQQQLFIELCDKAMVSAWGEGNFYTFARSAFDRDRTRTAIWNGDTEANFQGLRYSIVSGIRAGLLGFSQWGSDTGGYLRANGTPTEEVWARWMHFSTFVPMYEIMVGTNHTPWYDYSPRLVGVLKKTADLHTRLIPYIRSYTYQASQTGLPVIRALFLEYPSDGSVYETADEYAFGKEFLVAPIASEGGSRQVYFPKSSSSSGAGGGGSRFLEYFNKTAVYQPGTTANITNLPLEYSPVYVREGAIVVTGDVYQGNARWPTTSGGSGGGVWAPHLTIEFFPSYNVSSSTFTYYRGKEGAAPPGPATITLATDRNASSITITYDDLGLNGTLAIYHKSRVDGSTLVQNIKLPAPGSSQVLTVGGLISLFD